MSEKHFIFIPTKGRIRKQATVMNLPGELWPRTVLVCPPSENAELHKLYPHVMVISPEEENITIGKKRQWILEMAKRGGIEKLVMLDDDLSFAYRRTDDTARFLAATDEQIILGFAQLEEILCEEIPHAGFAARGGGIGEAAQKGGWQLGKRMMYVLGYHVPTVLANAELGRIGTHEDMDVCLQLLVKGYCNVVNFDLVVDQKFGSPGGCTEERTVELNDADCELLAKLHPNYVRLAIKGYKTSTPRVEVICSWMKALNDGLLNRE